MDMLQLTFLLQKLKEKLKTITISLNFDILINMKIRKYYFTTKPHYLINLDR